MIEDLIGKKVKVSVVLDNHDGIGGNSSEYIGVLKNVEDDMIELEITFQENKFRLLKLDKNNRFEKTSMILNRKFVSSILVLEDK